MDRPNSQRTLSLFHFPDLNEVSFSSFPLLNDEVDNVLAYMLPYKDKEGNDDHISNVLLFDIIIISFNSKMEDNGNDI